MELTHFLAQRTLSFAMICKGIMSSAMVLEWNKQPYGEYAIWRQAALSFDYNKKVMQFFISYDPSSPAFVRRNGERH